jgi:hypothetical protein
MEGGINENVWTLSDLITTKEKTMLAFDKEQGFIHCDVREETAPFAEGSTITIDGDWYSLRETIEDPENGYRVLVEAIPRPDPPAPLFSFFTIGEEKYLEVFQPRQ